MATPYIKVGTRNFMLREDEPITISRYEKLKNHPQFNIFYFFRSNNAYYWYVENAGAHSTMSTTEKEENNLLKQSYKEYLSKNKF